MADQAQRHGLAGRCVVVTRPAQQAGALLDALRAAGAMPLFFPVIDILPLADVSPLRALAERLGDYDYVFFVSANAIEQALAVIPRRQWPASLRMITVGPSSARALQAYGFETVLQPQAQFDSEGVLALPVLQANRVAGRRVLILRGDGGRELLAQTLTARGAQVEVLSCYRRRRAETDPTNLLAQLAEGTLDALSFTSSEGASNFVEIVNQVVNAGGVAASSLLAALPCFVPHSRIAAHLRALGAEQIILTDAGDTALIASLQHHFDTTSNRFG